MRYQMNYLVASKRTEFPEVLRELLISWRGINMSMGVEGDCKFDLSYPMIDDNEDFLDVFRELSKFSVRPVVYCVDDMYCYGTVFPEVTLSPYAPDRKEEMKAMREKLIQAIFEG